MVGVHGDGGPTVHTRGRIRLEGGEHGGVIGDCVYDVGEIMHDCAVADVEVVEHSREERAEWAMFLDANADDVADQPGPAFRVQSVVLIGQCAVVRDECLASIPDKGA